MSEPAARRRRADVVRACPSCDRPARYWIKAEDDMEAKVCGRHLTVAVDALMSASWVSVGFVHVPASGEGK